MKIDRQVSEINRLLRQTHEQLPRAHPHAFVQGRMQDLFVANTGARRRAGR